MTTFSERTRSQLEWVALFLAGPAIWYTHFWVVYLLAEAGCFAARGATTQPMWLIISILALTGVGVVLIAWTTVLAWRRWTEGAQNSVGPPALYFVGFLMGPLFALATLFVGIPAAVLPPC